MSKKKSEYTPGPWKIGFDDGSGGEDFWIVGPNETPVVHGQGDCCKLGGIRDEANARLIAAAPLLLEALQGVKVCPYCTFSNWSSGIRQHMKECKLNAAVKAATGE